MIRLINVPRYTLIVSILLVFILFSPIAVAKHIIVIYDVSGSMVSLKTGGRVKTFMESKDIRRVNEYLTNLLFTNTSQDLRDKVNDTYIEECDAAFVGKPLYQSGDILTYVEYAKQRSTKLNRAQVRSDEFQRQLPNPMTLKTSFYGMVSYLLRAEVEVYDALYNNADDETYWVFVTDGDIDNSGKSDPGIASVLQRHAIIEKAFYSPLIFSLFVNNHVKIEVRQLNETVGIDKIFIAKPTNAEESVKKIQLSKDDEGKFISETLTIYTRNSEKTKFKLNAVNVEIVDKFHKPLQIVKDNKFDILRVPPVLFHGNPPSYDFRIPFPANQEIAAPGNKLKLEVTYTYNGADKIYSFPFIDYTVFIDSIYIATLKNPDRPVKTLDLIFSAGKYVEDLIIQSESPNIDGFKIDQIRSHVQYKDNRKLCDATVPQGIKGLGESFNLEVPKQDRLDWDGNKVVLEIDYKYDKEAKSETIEIPYKLVGGGSGFPMWILWVFLVPALGLVVYFLISRIIPCPTVHHITLTEVSEAGTPLREKSHFILENKMTLEFGPRGPDELRLDVGSDAFLYCDKKNLLLFSDADADEGKVLDLPETLTLSSGEDDDVVHVRCEIADDASDEPEEDDEPIITSNASDASPLDV